METNETEIKQKLIEMKNELCAKQMKLDKLKRAKTVKAHVRQKIQEQNLIKCTVSNFISTKSNSDMPIHSHSEVTLLKCAPEVSLVHKLREYELLHATRDNITIKTVALPPGDINLIHLVPCSSTLDVEPEQPATYSVLSSASHSNLKEENRLVQQGDKCGKANLQLKQVTLKKEGKRELNHSTEKLELSCNKNPKISNSKIHENISSGNETQMFEQLTSTDRETKDRIYTGTKQSLVNTFIEGMIASSDKTNSCNKIKQRYNEQTSTFPDMIDVSEEIIASSVISAGHNLGGKSLKAVSKRKRQESFCNDDFIQYSKMTKKNEFRKYSNSSSLQQNKCKTLAFNKDWQLLSKNKEHFLSDTTDHKPFTQSHENIEKFSKLTSLTSKIACGKSESVINGSSRLEVQDCKSLGGSETDSSIRMSNLVPDNCCQPEDLLDRQSQNVLTNNLTPCDISCLSEIENKGCTPIDGVDNKDMYLGFDTRIVDILNEPLTGNCVPNISKISHFKNVIAASFNESKKQLVSGADAASNIDTTNYPGKIIHSCPASKSDSFPTVTIQAYKCSLDIRYLLRTNASDENTNQTSKEHSNESDEIVKGSQISNVTLKPPHCGSKQSLTLNADHSQNMLPLTPSFESLPGQLSNRSPVETIANYKQSICEQELVTDSEFLNILGLTPQNNGEVLSNRETQAVNSLTSRKPKCEIFSSLSKTYKNDCNEMQQNSCFQNLSDRTSTSSTYEVTEVSGRLQLEGSSEENSFPGKENLSEFTVATCDNTDHQWIATDVETSENTFSEYTELDVIPYSQFELTEDFLSEMPQSQESMNKGGLRPKSSGALVKRRSSRISSVCFTHANSLSADASFRPFQSVSASENFDSTKPNVKSNQKRSLVQQNKAAAVLSVLQFLIDEAKKNNSFMEFVLPATCDTLKVNRIESAVRPPYFFEEQIIPGKDKENIEIQECKKNKNEKHILNTFSSVQDFRSQSYCTNKKDVEKVQHFTAMQESITNGNEQYTKKAINIYVDNGQGFIYHSGTAGDLFEMNQETSMERDLEVDSFRCRDWNITSGEITQECLQEINNRNSDLCNNTNGNSSESLQRNQHKLNISGNCSTPLKWSNKNISKLRRKVSNSSIAKQLFITKIADFHAGFHDVNDGNIPDDVDMVRHSVDNVAFTVDNASSPNRVSQMPKLQNGDISLVCMSQRSTGSSCPKGWSSFHRNSPSPQPGLHVRLTETPRTPNTVCSHSPADKFNPDVSTPEQLLQSDSISLLTTPTNPSHQAHLPHTSNTSVEFQSPELNCLFLDIPNPITPIFEATNQLSSTQNSRARFSLTSTPKMATTITTADIISNQGFKSSLNLSLEKHHPNGPDGHSCPQPTTTSSRPESSDLLISSNDHILHPDESYLSPAQIPAEVKDLLDIKDVSLDRMLDISTTSSNVVTPWKQLPKTASTPVFVFEKGLKHHIGTPVFSPNIRRSRSKPASSSGSTRHNYLRFAGCFQCCAQDAVVSLLSGTLKTKENEEKNYIVSVQATSLTVWTEDSTSGWTPELDWRLSPEIHVRKACLLPRTDTVIAVVASGWDKRDLFATLFMYDWSTENTARFNIPVLEQQIEIRSPTQIELCPYQATELHIAVTSDTRHTVGRVLFTKSLSAVQCLSMFGVHRGKLINLVAVKSQVSASVSLTGDQEVAIWNMKLGVVLKKIKLQSTLPCLTGLLAADSQKGILLLDTIWRVDDGDCGGVIAVNPLSGHTQKIIRFSTPDNTWRSIESAQSENNLVTAISDKGSLGIWDKQTGVLLSYTKSKIATCASIMTMRKYLIVGEIYGCLHIYSPSI